MKLYRSTSFAMVVGLVAGCSGAVNAPIETAQTTASLSVDGIERVAPKRQLSYNRVPTKKERLTLGLDAKGVPVNKPAAAPAAATTGATATMTYNNGVLLQSVEVYAVYWGPNVNPEVVAGLPGFFQALTGSPLMTSINEYNTGSYVIGSDSFKGAVTDTDAPMPAAGANLQDADIRAEIGRLIDTGKLPANNGKNLYMMYFPAGVTIDQGGGQVSCAVFCGYHNVFTRNGTNAYYAIMPDHYSNGCDMYCGPETAHLDNLYRTSSHELVEAITDPDVGTGYYDQTWAEVGDICASWDGTTAGYKVQTMWSQAVIACRDHAATTPSGAAVTVTNAAPGVSPGTAVFTISSKGTGSGSLTLEEPDINLADTTAGNFNGSFSQPTIPINGGSGTMTINVPASLLTDTFSIHAGGYDSDNAHYFQTINLTWVGPAVALTGATPATGPSQGSTVELDGTGISPSASIYLCTSATKCTISATAVPLPGQYVSGSMGKKYDVQLPSHAAGKIYLGALNPGDTKIAATAITSFTYTAGAAPTVTTVDPPTGPIAGGTYVVVTGTNFGSNATVKIGSTALVANQSFAVFDAQTIAIITPAVAAAVKANIVITNADKQTVTTTFTYGPNSPPEIRSPQPDDRPDGGRPVPQHLRSRLRHDADRRHRRRRRHDGDHQRRVRQHRDPAARGRHGQPRHHQQRRADLDHALHVQRHGGHSRRRRDR